ncbi:hypothetical protein [Pseudodesulfovibrio sp.]|uniref:hypothetical protein n=1 Tax=Pseudodesulfovibrio sp. TaxID=2035812 RepID=UPI0026221AD5|nr:hypothetical protein [Pseudodesulfovibrio sp.]MDD3310660.1 hypothetical protein [Pseudodesulfovibrio sp.]
MRIFGSGSGNSGFGGGDDRSTAFRRGRRPGQKVRGRVLKRVADDMAWVEIEGHRLLAQLRSSPREGTWLVFVIRQLVPEIVLKELYESGTAATPRLETAASFEAARALFENRFRPEAAQVAALPAAERSGAFLTLLESAPKLRAAYLDALGCAGEITALFPPSHRLLYQPWLLPEARRQATVVRAPAEEDESRMQAAMVEFELPAFGLVRAEFLNKDGETGYRLKLQHPDRREALQAHLEAEVRPATGTVRCLGVAKLAQREHGGIVAELLFAR